MNPAKRIILGIDPGVARVGWGAIAIEKGGIFPIDYGVIETDNNLSFEKRIVLINTQLENLLKIHQPTLVCYEDIFFYKNVKTGIMISKSLGTILLTVIQKNIPVYSFTPLQIKQSLTGYGRASKQQIQKMVQAILKLKTIPKPDDAADALAIAICGSQKSLWRYKN